MSPARLVADLGAALQSPVRGLGAPRRTWALAALYLAAATALLGATAWLIATYRVPLRAWLVEQAVPEAWRFATRWLVDHLLADQERMLAANLVATGSLLLVTMVLFPLKELVSRSFEERAGLVAEPVDELPLWEQAWQEAKLFLLFVAVQGSLFWMGLRGRPWRTAAVVIGALFLCFSFALDFVSPILQRHRGRYSQIIKLLATTPLATLGFGALFAAPALVIGRLWTRHPEWPVGPAVLLVFAGTVVGIVWACLAGTWLGARLQPRLAATPRSHPATRGLAWLVVAALLAGNAYGFGAVASSLQAKSQILNCRYRVDFASFRVDTSSLAALLDDEARIGVRFDVEIENPTAIDLELEANRVELRHRGDLVATARLSPVRVPAGQTEVQTVGAEVALTPSLLGRGRELLRAGELTLTLFVRVSDHIDFPVDLVGER